MPNPNNTDVQIVRPTELTCNELPYCRNSFCQGGPAIGQGCVVDADCVNGLFCDGAETCNAGTCQAGGDPCPGQTCDEGGDVCVPAGGCTLELLKPWNNYTATT